MDEVGNYGFSSGSGFRGERTQQRISVKNIRVTAPETKTIEEVDEEETMPFQKSKTLRQIPTNFERRSSHLLEKNFLKPKIGGFARLNSIN